MSHQDTLGVESTTQLIPPHGGLLVDLMLPSDDARFVKEQAARWPTWDLTQRQLCDLELLATGGFSPLAGFMTRTDYESVCDAMRLADGTLWPIPVTLDITPDVAARLDRGERLLLRDAEGVSLAVMLVEDVWTPDRMEEARLVYGTTDPDHTGVAETLRRAGTVAVGGRLEVLQRPVHRDFRTLRFTPRQLRDRFARAGWRQVVAFQTRNPLHRAHQELTLRAAREADAHLLQAHQAEIGVRMVPFRMMTYVAELDRYVPEDEVPHGLTALTISGSELRRRLSEDEELPSWFTFPDVVRELRRTHPRRDRRGLTIFFTGLSGSGKSTIANILVARLLEYGRRVTLLDGDLVRKHLSSELGFSKEHRDLNIRRIGFVASEVTRHSGVAICAPIAPYESVREEVRQLIEPWGAFVLVYLSTSLEVCEQRDRKGLYQKARAGLVQQFTGISDPYEAPDNATLEIDTASMSAQDAADLIVQYLESQELLPDRGRPSAEAVPLRRNPRLTSR